MLFLTVMGPGIITANIDNDASGITTYSVVGARHGLGLFVDIDSNDNRIDCCAGNGCANGCRYGKGLADLIREEFGVKAAFYMLLGLLIANFGNTVANFAGWAGQYADFGIQQICNGTDWCGRDLGFSRQGELPDNRKRSARCVSDLCRIYHFGHYGEA